MFRLSHAKSVFPLPDSRLTVRFTDGASGTLDLSPLIACGGVFARLADPAAFAQARIGAGGRTVEWPDDIDLCADALRLSLEQGGYLMSL